MTNGTDTADAIVKRIRATDKRMERAEIAGLAREPHKGEDTKESCGNCIYFLAEHQYCNQPELEFPVDEDWWCRLWRV